MTVDPVVAVDEATGKPSTGNAGNRAVCTYRGSIAARETLPVIAVEVVIEGEDGEQVTNSAIVSLSCGPADSASETAVLHPC